MASSANEGQPALAVLNTALRSQRNLAASLPIARAPGIALNLSAVFFEGQYTAAHLANLTSVLFDFGNRLLVDLYWDAAARHWQLCPQPLPSTAPLVLPSPSPALASASSAPSPSPPAPRPPGTAANTETVIAADVAIDGVVCSSNRLGLSDIVKHARGFLANATDTEWFNPITIVINLHSLNQSAPSTPLPPGSPLPRTLSDELAPFSDSIYTPAKLLLDRASGSLQSPYSTSGGVAIANNTFPTPKDLGSHQILVAFGNTSGFAGPGAVYNISADNATIFSAPDLGTLPVISTSMFTAAVLPSCARPAAGIAMAGTGFDIAASNFTVPPASVARTDTVVSWNFAYVADTPDSPFTPSLVAQVSQCGFTPLFSKSYTLEFINATLWSWADGQPSQDYYRNCALMDLATGRWITENCANAYPPACADLTTAPFTWVVDPASARQYDTIESQGLCKAPLVFAIPRTAQEHASLLGAMRLAGVQRAWISYNRVSPVCWVKGWQRPCPYQFPKDLLFGRLLGANLKQGIFILLVSVVFLIYQARSQWKASRENRRRAEVRKKIKQMEYRSVRKVE